MAKGSRYDQQFKENAVVEQHIKLKEKARKTSR